MQCSWGKFQGTEHFVRDREIFEIQGSRDRESPLYKEELNKTDMKLITNKFTKVKDSRIATFRLYQFRAKFALVHLF